MDAESCRRFGFLDGMQDEVSPCLHHPRCIAAEGQEQFPDRAIPIIAVDDVLGGLVYGLSTHVIDFVDTSLHLVCPLAESLCSFGVLAVVISDTGNGEIPVFEVVLDAVIDRLLNFFRTVFAVCFRESANSCLFSAVDIQENICNGNRLLSSSIRSPHSEIMRFSNFLYASRYQRLLSPS